MALIVQKYGGTSVGNLERIQAVADKIIKTQALGHQVVVVVSAMSGETDRLSHLAHSLSRTPNPRELDVLLSTGEQSSMALLSMALTDRGCIARSYTGAQVKILTDSIHNKARILSIDSSKIKRDLSEGRVVVVAGFQGMDEFGNITTLGRGGSDTTAVALAAALKADECHIYTDVDGIYTADPKVVADSRKISQITMEEMLEMSGSGAKVMQTRAVEFAGRYKVPVRVLSSFEDDGLGTLITSEENMEYPVVSGIAFNRDEAKLVIYGIQDKPGMAAAVFGPLSDAHIEVDMILQTLAEDGKTDLAFTVHHRDFKKASQILEKVASDLTARGFQGDEKVAKISLVGVGMRSHAGVASRLFHTLGNLGINIQLVSTSEIKISVVIGEIHLESAVRGLHHAFQLGNAS